MRKTLITLLVLLLLGFGGWVIWKRFSSVDNVESRHQILVERIEAMGKLELVKYRLSDVVEHKNISAYLPDASVLLIVKADAVGCVNLANITPDDIEVIGDSVTIQLPRPEICYVRIDHDESRVYDTKMAFFREAQLVDAAYKAAETQIMKEVRQSDILEQTKANATNVFRPLLQGLGYSKVNLSFAK